MPELHPTIVEHDGAPGYVVLPYAEFLALKSAAANYADDAEWDILFEDTRSEATLDKLYAEAASSGAVQDMAEGFRTRAERRKGSTPTP